MCPKCGSENTEHKEIKNWWLSKTYYICNDCYNEF